MSFKINRIVKSSYGNVTPLRLWAAWQISFNFGLHKRLPRLTKFGKNMGIVGEEVKKITKGEIKKTKPVWRLPYSYPKQNLSEMFKEIQAGTYTGDFFMRREILIQCREKGIIQFNGEDKDAHIVPLQDITVIPQQENQRGGHK
jgi:hypothetical protein